MQRAPGLLFVVVVVAVGCSGASKSCTIRSCTPTNVDVPGPVVTVTGATVAGSAVGGEAGVGAFADPVHAAATPAIATSRQRAGVFSSDDGVATEPVGAVSDTDVGLVSPAGPGGAAQASPDASPSPSEAPPTGAPSPDAAGASAGVPSAQPASTSQGAMPTGPGLGSMPGADDEAAAAAQDQSQTYVIVPLLPVVSPPAPPPPPPHR